ncbi:4a-hydroxytetrahydrobiopterin dehydratase [Fodinicola feengrottensis]|uniref:4a-hydroxytetrahydrobiopterin dehydratase n=1 Tax=Fodinicola feengrottensis TaxID=435914 RepID=UPI0013D1CAD8|nr:4a-hydroxytetrahydrobiopterin dehydratase [Fodinicola feengrottensis]
MRADEVAAALAGLTGWEGDAAAIRRQVEAADFPTAIQIVDDIAVAAEQADHHPDIDIRWRTLRLVLATHSEGGVTAKDLELARTIDGIVAAHS